VGNYLDRGERTTLFLPLFLFAKYCSLLKGIRLQAKIVLPVKYSLIVYLCIPGCYFLYLIFLIYPASEGFVISAEVVAFLTLLSQRSRFFTCHIFKKWWTGQTWIENSA
jgi:hypothetical protein